MSYPFCLVVNPSAAKGRGMRRLPEVLGVLGAAGATAEVRESSSLANAVEVALRATGEGKVVVAVGGDGMVGALAGALAGGGGAAAATTAPGGPGAVGAGTAGAAGGGVFGIIPAGRGNDFARMLGIPARPAEAARTLLTGQPTAVDLIGVRVGDSSEFTVAGSVYLGVPSEAGEFANRSRWVLGPVGYQVAGLRAVLRWQPATFTVRIPAAQQGAPFGGFCVLVANSAYFAGGTCAAPGADLADGLLEVLTVRAPRAAPSPGTPLTARLPLGWKLPFLRVMLAAGRGDHLRLPEVGLERAASVTVSVDRAMPAAADGETLPFAAPLTAGSALHVRALPGALRVIVPGDSAGGLSAAAAEEGLGKLRAR